VGRDGAEGSVNSAVEIFVSIFLFGLTSPSPKSKKVCQPMKPARCATPAAQVVGVGPALLRRVEDEAEERLSVVAGEIRAIGGPHHAVPHRRDRAPECAS
jgi:hypothetical protein